MKRKITVLAVVLVASVVAAPIALADAGSIAEGPQDVIFADEFTSGSLSNYEFDEWVSDNGGSTNYEIDNSSLYFDVTTYGATTDNSGINATYSDTFEIQDSFSIDFDSKFETDESDPDSLNNNRFNIELRSAGESLIVSYRGYDNFRGWQVGGTLVEDDGNETGIVAYDWTSTQLEFDTVRGVAELWADGEKMIETDIVSQFDGEVELSYKVSTQGTSDYSNADIDVWMDQITISEKPSVTGTVTDRDGDPVENATVNATADGETTTAETDADGRFELDIYDAGTYTLEISHPRYQTHTETIEVEPGDHLGTFRLDDNELELDVRNYLPPDNQLGAEYTVRWTDADGETHDVTGDADVTSSNTSVVEIDGNEIVPQDDVNDSVNITATYDAPDGETYEDVVEVTVATATLENVEILPGVWRFNAFLGDVTIQVLLIAIGAGIVATRAATSFAGIGAVQMVVMVGWFGGYVPIGIALVGLFTSMFIGFNLAANIDYTMQR